MKVIILLTEGKDLTIKKNQRMTLDTRLIYYLFILNVYNVILNPFGKIGNFPIKIIFFVLLVICLSFVIFLYILKNKIILNKRQWISFGILCFCIFYLFVINSLIGLAKGNRLEYVLDNTNGYLFTFYIAVTIWFLNYKSINLERLIKHFVFAATIVSLFSITIFISYFVIPSLYLSLGEIVFKYKVGSIFPYQGFIRVFLKNQIYSLAISIFLLIGYIKFHSRKYFVLALINIIPPFLSFTRSFWFAFIITILFFYFLEAILFFHSSTLHRISKNRIMISVISLIIIIYFFNIPIVKDRLSSSFSISDIGNAIRLEQHYFTMGHLSKDVLFGIGPGGLYLNQIYAIESTYHDSLSRYGIIGFIILVILLIYPLVNIIYKNIIYHTSFVIINYFFYGYIVILLVSFTNPFLISSLGMLYLGFVYGIFLTQKYKSKS